MGALWSTTVLLRYVTKIIHIGVFGSHHPGLPIWPTFNQASLAKGHPTKQQPGSVDDKSSLRRAPQMGAQSATDSSSTSSSSPSRIRPFQQPFTVLLTRPFKLPTGQESNGTCTCNLYASACKRCVEPPSLISQTSTFFKSHRSRDNSPTLSTGLVKERKSGARKHTPRRLLFHLPNSLEVIKLTMYPLTHLTASLLRWLLWQMLIC
jgi:hypothetical protein